MGSSVSRAAGIRRASSAPRAAGIHGSASPQMTSVGAVIWSAAARCRRCGAGRPERSAGRTPTARRDRATARSGRPRGRDPAAAAARSRHRHAAPLRGWRRGAARTPRRGRGPAGRTASPTGERDHVDERECRDRAVMQEVRARCWRTADVVGDHRWPVEPREPQRRGGRAPWPASETSCPGRWSDAPKPSRSNTYTLKRSARRSATRRHVHDDHGVPCTITTGSPSPSRSQAMSPASVASRSRRTPFAHRRNAIRPTCGACCELMAGLAGRRVDAGRDRAPRRASRGFRSWTKVANSSYGARDINSTSPRSPSGESAPRSATYSTSSVVRASRARAARRGSSRAISGADHPQRSARRGGGWTTCARSSLPSARSGRGRGAQPAASTSLWIGTHFIAADHGARGTDGGDQACPCSARGLTGVVGSSTRPGPHPQRAVAPVGRRGRPSECRWPTSSRPSSTAAATCARRSTCSRSRREPRGAAFRRGVGSHA